MSAHSIRAKIKHKNSDIHLGYYQTQAQATAAKAGAHMALDKWEVLHPPQSAPKKKMPSLKTLIHFIHQGTYDPVIKEIAKVSTSRYQLLKQHKNVRGTLLAATPAKTKVAPFDASLRRLNRTKPTASVTHR